MQSASDTFSEALIILIGANIVRDAVRWIGRARLLAEVPSTSIEYCEVYKIPSRVGFPWVPGSPGPGPLFLPIPSAH